MTTEATEVEEPVEPVEHAEGEVIVQEDMVWKFLVEKGRGEVLRAEHPCGSSGCRV